jgi:mannose-6-phosphate isomerase-like protein (cupin superfamily)
MSGLEIYSHTGTGFLPLVRFGAWRVALSNSGPVYGHKTITRLSRHLETDEVFVLLSGSAELLIGGKGDAPGEVEKVWMEPGKLYNVTKGTWHARLDLPGARILIVENDNTSKANSEQCDLPAETGL